MFGPNSAGKTSVLEAAEQLVTRAEIRRTDPADPTETYAEGSVFFDLPAADLPGTADAGTYRWLLCGEHSQERAWDWLGDGVSERIRHASLDQAREYLAGRLAGSGNSGSPDDRALLACGLFTPSALFFTVLDDGIVMLAREASLPGEVTQAARRITAEETGDDPLREIAAHLVGYGSARVAVLADGPEVRQNLAAASPPVTVLDNDPGLLPADLARSLPRVHDRLWDLHLAREPADGLPGVIWEEVDDFLMQTGTYERETYEADPWLEGLSQQGEPVVSGPFGAYDQASWYRVRHSVLAAARLIEEEANRVAPGFVGDQGTIGIEVLPVAAWGSGQHRVRATFTGRTASAAT